MDYEGSEDAARSLQLVTRVDENEDTLTWTLQNFGDLRSEGNMELLSSTVGEAAGGSSDPRLRWYMKFRRTNFEDTMLDFYLCTLTLPPNFYNPVKVQLSLEGSEFTKILDLIEVYIDPRGGNDFGAEAGANGYFAPTDANILSILESIVYWWAPTYLRVICKVRYKVHKTVSLQTRGFEPSPCPVYESFYLDRRFSDFSLVVENVVLPVHQVVLAAHSTVFAAMFEREMQENRNKRAEIPERVDVVRDMLCHIYCGSVKGLTAEKAIDLYKVADLYDLQRLRKECVAHLCHNITDEVSHLVLELANRYGDVKLFNIVRNFINQKLSPEY